MLTLALALALAVQAAPASPEPETPAQAFARELLDADPAGRAGLLTARADETGPGLLAALFAAADARKRTGDLAGALDRKSVV